jgi:hypothetical protein
MAPQRMAWTGSEQFSRERNDMNLRTYRPIAGASYGIEAAQRIGSELEDLGLVTEVTPAAIVAKAQNPETELHRHFEWHDETAADKYRQHQARQIVNHLAIVIQAPDGSPREVKAFHSVAFAATETTPHREAYVHIDIIRSTPDMGAQTLAKAKRDLESWRRRYEELRGVLELEDVFSALDRMTAAA